MELKEINKVSINVPIHKGTGEKHKGYELFDIKYPNIFLLGKKRSGKTVIIYNILKKMIQKHHIVYIISSTVNKDDNWKTITDFLDTKGIQYETYHSIKEAEIDDIIAGMQEPDIESDDEEESTITQEKPFGLWTLPRPGEITKSGLEKKKKKKPKPPEYWFIFDDLSTELRNTSVEKLLKKNRHFKARTIISSQYLNDLMPASRLQLDYVLVFPNLPEEKLEELRRNTDLPLTFDQLKKMYKKATEKPFNFLYVNTRTPDYRVNFNQQFSLP